MQVWASEDESAEFPYLGGKPPIPGDLARLEQRMSLAGVQGALVVQPINHKFDHAYVNRALQVRAGRVKSGGGQEATVKRCCVESRARAIWNAPS